MVTPVIPTREDEDGRENGESGGGRGNGEGGGVMWGKKIK